MAKQRSRGATRGNKSGTPAWAIFVAGAVCGSFLTFLVFLGGKQPTAATPPKTAAVPKPAKPAKPQPPESQTQFDFFTLLPEREVMVPDEPAAEIQAEAAQDQYHYILQAGSFRNAKDADRLRAKLILLGLEAKMEAVQANGDTWHRVYVGPYNSRSNMAKARGTMISEGVDVLVLKRKNAG